MITNGKLSTLYFITYFVDSQVLSVSNNTITSCSPVVQGIAARIFTLVNNRGAKGGRNPILKVNKGGDTPIGSKNDIKLKFRVTPISSLIQGTPSANPDHLFKTGHIASLQDFHIFKAHFHFVRNSQIACDLRSAIYERMRI